MPMYESALAVAINDDPRSVQHSRAIAAKAVLEAVGQRRLSAVIFDHYPCKGAQKAIRADGRDLVLNDEELIVCARYPKGVLIVASVEIPADHN